MIRWLPAPLHRLGLRLAHALRKRWWRLARPDLAGVCVIGLDDAGRVLLVRHSYGTRLWALPGGAVGRGEAPAIAARREWAEEIGCALADLRLVGVLEHSLHGARNTVHIYAGRIVGQPRADGREIAALGLFARDDLPEDRSRALDARLALLERA